MTTPPRPPSEEPLPYNPRNFWAWVAYQFFYRIGWQFKMEATLVAGLISYLTGDQRTLGLFTTINALGRQTSPLAVAPHVDRWQSKRASLLLYWGMTVLCWAALTVYLWTPYAQDRQRTLLAFGLCYTLFFICLGASSVAQGALLGKVIPANYRGRAMAAGMGLSGAINVIAILVVFYLAKRSGIRPPQNYALAFSVTVVCFVMAAFSLLAVREPLSPPRDRGRGVLTHLATMIEMTRRNRNLRLLMLVNVAVAVGGSLLQFYTGYWRQFFPPGRFPEDRILIATLFQVFWQSLSSALLGRVTDVRGNRIVICALLWVEVCVPLSAIAMGRLPALDPQWTFLLVYTLIGIRFPVYQLLINYLLEILPMEDHALGLGATNTIQIVTAPAPLLLGILAYEHGYPVAFLVAAVFLALAATLALRLEEPRFTSRPSGPD